MPSGHELALAPPTAGPGEGRVVTVPFGELHARLRDERGGRVAFVSRCLLNENTAVGAAPLLTLPRLRRTVIPATLRVVE